MNKSELIDAVSKTTSLAKREADAAVNAFIHAVASEMKAGRRVVVAGFGSFNPTRRGARVGRNPQTGAPVAISASRGVRFAPSAMLKDILNGRSPLPQLRPPASSRTAGSAGKAAISSSRASTKTAKKSTSRPPAEKVAQGSKKVVRRAPATKAAKRVRARKAANQSARKAVRRAPAKTSPKYVRARKAVKRSARRP